MWLNGSPGGLIDIDGALNTAVSVSVDDGRITHIYAIRNPHKLVGLDGIAALARSRPGTLAGRDVNGAVNASSAR